MKGPNLRREFDKAAFGATRKNERLRTALTHADLDLLLLASEAFEGIPNAAAWLTQSAFGLGGAVPIIHARTGNGKAEVVALIRRIDYGVY